MCGRKRHVGILFLPLFCKPKTALLKNKSLKHKEEYFTQVSYNLVKKEETGATTISTAEQNKCEKECRQNTESKKRFY